jgi:hypothetical protein
MVNAKVCLLDLDGSLADYDSALTPIMRSLQSPGEPEYKGRDHDDFEEPHIAARRKLVQSKPDFWRNLPRHPLGFQLLDEVRKIGFDLHILTKGPRTSPAAWSEKLVWATEHVPDAKMHVSEDKSLVYGRVLIDDFIPYAKPWLEKRPRGVVVAVAQPWNRDFRHDRFYRYDGSNLPQIIEVLQKAFDR